VKFSQVLKATLEGMKENAAGDQRRLKDLMKMFADSLKTATQEIIGMKDFADKFVIKVKVQMFAVMYQD